MRVRSETATVLITVKATPQPSEKYGDTSCVAGLRLDGESPSWIRLYPIAFRWIADSSQFAKYDIVDFEVRRRDRDTRSESYSPSRDSWKVISSIPPWRRRHELISQIAPTTTCELSRAASLDPAAPSLGLVYPADVTGLDFEPHPPWTGEQLRKMQQREEAERSALLPTSGSIPKVLRAPRFKVRYRYRCEAKGCRGHAGRILDWELTALQNRLHGSDNEVKAAVRAKFLDQMFAGDRAAGLYLGNFELAARRASFSVLGVYWPRITDTTSVQSALF